MKWVKKRFSFKVSDNIFHLKLWPSPKKYNLYPIGITGEGKRDISQEIGQLDTPLTDHCRFGFALFCR